MLKQAPMDRIMAACVVETRPVDNDQPTGGLGAFSGVATGLLASGALWLCGTALILTLL